MTQISQMFPLRGSGIVRDGKVRPRKHSSVTSVVQNQPYPLYPEDWQLQAMCCTELAKRKKPLRQS